MNPHPLQAFVRAFGTVAGALAAALTLALVGAGTVGCGPAGGGGRFVVVYAAQDRTHAEPVFAEFTRTSGIEVRAVYDNEATKTVGLANRILGERHRPLADVWWSNEEMRTRQLVDAGVLESPWIGFGVRRRVLVCRTNDPASLAAAPGLSLLTNAAWRGRVVIAYPLFGSTSTHLMMLRQRWGEAAWVGWCEALRANRVLMVDGNSQVVRRVAAGDAVLGLTDTDDVEAARREGQGVVALPLAASEDLAIPNTVTLVRGAPHPEPARELVRFLTARSTLDRLVAAGAFSEAPARAGSVPHPGEGSGADPWHSLLRDLEPVTRRMEDLFRR